MGTERYRIALVFHTVSGPDLTSMLDILHMIAYLHARSHHTWQAAYPDTHGG